MPTLVAHVRQEVSASGRHRIVEARGGCKVQRRIDDVDAGRVKTAPEAEREFEEAASWYTNAAQGWARATQIFLRKLLIHFGDALFIDLSFGFGWGDRSRRKHHAHVSTLGRVAPRLLEFSTRFLVVRSRNYDCKTIVEGTRPEVAIDRLPIAGLCIAIAMCLG